MTEYDYSPEAHERYISKQNAISRWAIDTSQYTPANPFLPLELSPSPYTEQPRGWTSQDDDFGRERSPPPSHNRHRRDDRDHYQRPHYDRYHSHQSHRPHRPKHSRSSSSPPPQSSTSTPPYPPGTPPTPGQYHRQHPVYNQRQYSYDSRHATPLPAPSPSPARYTSYEQPSSNQPTLIPVNGGYVLVPPKGVSYQIVQQPPPPDHAQPWYKRVFSPTTSVSGKNNTKLSKSSSSGSSNRKRSKKWSLDIY